MNNLKPLAAGTVKFPANGKEYIIEQQVSFDRWIQYEEIQEELMWGLTPKEQFNNLQKIIDEANEGNIANVGIIAREQMLGVKRKLDKRWPTALRMCALFCNTADEDRKTITEEMINIKIADWRAEGYDINSFFTLALTTIPGYLDILNSITRDISK